MGNHIGDEKHYILHCTNINFIEPRKSFLTKLYRINTNNSLINSSPKDVTQWILSEKLVKEMSETGKFLHLILELAEKLLTLLPTAGGGGGAFWPTPSDCQP